MTTTNRPIVVSVFQDNNKAQQAVNDLMNTGFSNDQIKYSVNKGGGGIADDLVNLGLPQSEANFYNNEFEQGHTIVTVNTTDRQQDAQNILNRDGGYDINSRVSNPQAQTRGAMPTAGANAASNVANTVANTGSDLTDEQTRNVRLREEQLQVSKQPVQTGEVGIRKEVVTEQKTVNVPVTREEVVIERRPGSGQVTDEAIGQDETIRVPVSEEQVNVTKQTVDTGEVAIGKRTVQGTQQVSDTVQREQARVVREGDVNVAGENPQDIDMNNQGVNPPNTTNQ
jgi:uncharacterized protein (TIGR02271 family)